MKSYNSKLNIKNIFLTYVTYIKIPPISWFQWIGIQTGEVKLSL